MASSRRTKSKSSRKAPSPPREFDWIRWIRRLESAADPGRLEVGIGDDAAVWRTGRAGVVLTVDTQVEGVHFRESWLTPRQIGWRSVASSLSDLAAMAARPACILVSVTAPADYSARSFRELYRGIHEAARRWGAVVAGGNLAGGPLSVTVAAVGEAPRQGVRLRSGARPADAIWVTGSPGLACAGRSHLEAAASTAGSRVRPGSVPAPLRKAVAAFRRPEARVEEALAIARAFKPSAMVDISDGLGADLGHILAESSHGSRRGLGAVLREEALLGLPHLEDACRRMRIPAVDACLEGGEDYELAFTARPSPHDEARRRAFTGATGVPLTRVGVIQAASGLWIETAAGRRRVAARGWAHF